MNFTITPELDKFMIIASDGIWEFISSQVGVMHCQWLVIQFSMYCIWSQQEAVDIVEQHRAKGNDHACKELIRVATAKWADDDASYRDDVSSILPCLQSW
jgi:serine/threonine protein phosphatase PrpC